jgi:hypothetical protein
MTTETVSAAPAPRSFSIGWLWTEAKKLYLFVNPLRFSFLALLVIAFAFLISGQGYDIIANLAEDDPTGATAPHTGQRIGFVFAIIFLALQVWYWSRQLLHAKPAEGSPHHDEFPWLTRWLPRILGVLAFVIAIGSLLRVAQNYEVPEPVAVLWRLSIELAVAMLLFIAFTVLRRRRVKTAVTEEVDFRDRPPLTRLMLAISIILALALFAWSTFFVQSTVILGSAAVVVLAFALTVPIGSTIVWIGIRRGVPVLTFLLLWAVIVSPLADNHVLKTIPNGLAASRPTVAQGFDAWFTRLSKQYPPGPDGKYPVFIVAAEGGGIRAAYWSATVMASLTDTIPGFSDHLFALSGVSGGALGSAVYASLLSRRGDYQVDLDSLDYDAKKGETNTLRFAASQVLGQDALAPTLASMTQPDFVQRFVPVPIFPDRARALEGGLEHAWRTAINRRGQDDDTFANGFLQMMNGRYDRTPSLFLNGTLVETGQRIVASNLRITGTGTEDLARTVDLFDVIGGDVAVSTAMNNSARFSYVAPAGTLPGTHPVSGQHVVDGGYFENSGSATANDILGVIARSRYAARVRPHVIFIEFDMADPAAIQRARFANEVLSPVRALAAVRGAHADLSRELLRNSMKGDSTTFTLVQDKAVFPLGWLLADRTRNLMDAQMGPDSAQNGANVKRIAALLQQGVKADPMQELAEESEAKPNYQ